MDCCTQQFKKKPQYNGKIICFQLETSIIIKKINVFFQQLRTVKHCLLFCPRNQLQERQEDRHHNFKRQSREND
jgi:hypothetical protein